MFDLCSDTESAKTIKRLLDVVDSLSARLRTGGLRSRESTSAVQALHKQIIQLV
jgi:molecular chaperone GrpE (heat shock protein)